MQAPFQKKRFMVPRWRTLDRALSVGEVRSVRLGPSIFSQSLPSIFIKRLERWRIEPSVLTAAELVSSAIVYGYYEEAVRAARYLMREGVPATDLVKSQAAEILRRTDGRGIPNIPPLPNVWRQRTRLNPEDALAWVELARIQIINGGLESAKRSMVTALSLAPNNRHVLIAASRLFLHEGDVDRSRDIILGGASSGSDPWLIAAEIGLSRVAEKPSKLIKKGISILQDRKLIPRQLTELAGAVGTDELTFGGRKKAVAHFRDSMRDPTGNSLAQAEWATPHLGVELVPEQNLIRISDSSEAKAIRLFRERQYEQMPEACRAWSQDEPYSVRPYDFGAMVSGLIAQHDEAIWFAKQGLRIKPGWPNFLNAMAFNLASKGNVVEAEECLRQMRTKNEMQLIIAEANKGLIAFRLERYEEGTSRYENSILKFRQNGDGYLAAVASTYFAREALKANLSAAPRIVERARSALRSFPSSPVAFLADRDRWLDAPSAD